MDKRIEVLKYYNREIVINNTNKLFVFGENEKQQSTNAIGGGQAVIRNLENTFGFCTLKAIGDYWVDEYYEINKQKIQHDIATLISKSHNYDVIVFPFSGLGTGRANMLKSCPLTFLYMSRMLLKHFGFNNIENLTSQPF
jgi:hypothetical protein